MNVTPVYNIPVSRIDAYRGQRMIVRSNNPALLVASLATQDLEGISYIQILALDGGDVAPLKRWDQPIPLDLVVRDVQEDLPRLYQYSPLLTKHPIRVTIPMVPGFSKLVKLAVSLDFAVKLDGSQPEPGVLEELAHVQHLYLHQVTTSQPIEFFHSLFLAFYRGEPATLWAIQEEDPSLIRFITDTGEETLSHRAGASIVKEVSPSFVSEHLDRLLARRAECSRCEFLEHCCGYFKWPRREYPCEGMRGLLHTLRSAADQLRGDLASYEHSAGVGGHDG